jgi:flagellar biosynthetic protein FliR
MNDLGMTFTADQLLQWVGAFMWPFIRISAMLLAMPLFGAQGVTARWRLTFSLLLAFVVAPQLPPLPTLDPLSLRALLIAIEQVLIGVTMGFLLQLVFSALMQAGQSMGLAMGLGFAQVVDPASGIQVPLVSQFFLTVGMLIFLSLNGHLIVIKLMVLSFTALPIGEHGFGSAEIWSLLRFGSDMYNTALLIALPALASFLVVNLSMGVIAKAAPQLHIFVIGFPIMKLVGITLMGLLLPGLAARFADLLTLCFDLIQQLLGI